MAINHADKGLIVPVHSDTWYLDSVQVADLEQRSVVAQLTALFGEHVWRYNHELHREGRGEKVRTTRDYVEAISVAIPVPSHYKLCEGDVREAIAVVGFVNKNIAVNIAQKRARRNWDSPWLPQSRSPLMYHVTLRDIREKT